MTDRRRVEFFLAYMKRHASERFILINRAKNKGAIQRLGLSIETVKKIVLKLHVGNYSKGPLRDESGKHNDVWVFGTSYEETDLYIKFSVTKTDGETGVVCVSFHEAERELDFPYGEQNGNN
ncbi:MAG: type II toxin-antitoxin system MqsR family toxin [Coriobacteriales bacterium]|jgi:hypothetical protein|nr:type II toxin-antitoxin system MqsR family toxin [Coriobacteriales bacterium]